MERDRYEPSFQPSKFFEKLIESHVHIIGSGPRHHELGCASLPTHVAPGVIRGRWPRRLFSAHDAKDEMFLEALAGGLERVAARRAKERVAW